MNVFYVLSILLCFLPQIRSSRQLLFSVLIFRHGERQRYDPLRPKAKCFKHLINQGMRQQYISGRHFRNRYRSLHLLPETWDPSIVYFRSTSLERSLVSSLSFYSGLYSADLFHSDASQFHNIELPIDTTFTLDDKMMEVWVPHGPAIYTINKNNDTLLYSYKKSVCPAFKNYRKEGWMNDRAKDLAEEGMLGEEAQKHPYERLANKPDIIKLGTHNAFSQILDYFHLSLADNRKQARRIIKRIEHRDPAFRLYQNWRLANPDGKTLKLVVYGSHDTMLVSLINGLGIKLEKRVSVSSVITFDLYIDTITKKPSVEVRFNKELLQLPTCKGYECKLKDFIRAVERYGTFEDDEEYLDKCQNLQIN